MGFVGDEPVSCISVVKYGEDYSFLGFYICRPEFRGRGHGMAIWNAGVARLEGRTIGLDGVVAQQPNYAKSGFVLAHRNIRHGGIPTLGGSVDPHIVELDPTNADFANAVLTYDRAFFPSGREAFLREWIAPPHRTVAYIEDGTVRGCGTIRACGKGHKIGPLFADNEPVAEAIFTALAGGVGGEEVLLDLPETNSAAKALAERHGLGPVFETARMYRGQAPTLPLDRTFGITSFELG